MRLLVVAIALTFAAPTLYAAEENLVFVRGTVSQFHTDETFPGCVAEMTSGGDLFNVYLPPQTIGQSDCNDISGNDCIEFFGRLNKAQIGPNPPVPETQAVATSWQFAYGQCAP